MFQPIGLFVPCGPLHAAVAKCGFWVTKLHESEIAVFIHFSLARVIG